METLYLLRHAHALPPEGRGGDFDRQLSDRGVKAAAAVGYSLMAELLPAPALIVTSPARRAAETAEIVAAGFAPAVSIRYLGSIYEAGVTQLLQVIEEAGAAADPLMIVGHNPGMEDLARRVTGSLLPMSPASLAVILCGGVDRLADGGCRLHKLLLPADPEA